jgi:hypothetical protein
MKTIVMTFAIAALSFAAQAPATSSAPAAKETASTTPAPVKQKHVKKTNKVNKGMDATAKPAPAATTPAAPAVKPAPAVK